MYLIHIFLLISLMFIACNNTRYYDKVECLKAELLKYGFQPDTTFNWYREYSWKVKNDFEDSILVREVEYFLTDTVCYDGYCRYLKSVSLHLYEYQLFPQKSEVYTEEAFPAFYERERKKGLFFDKFSNYRKGLRHLKSDRANEFQRKVVLDNRYILFVARMEDKNNSDTLFVRDILDKLRDGILEQRDDDAQLKYSLLKDNELIKRNLNAHRWYSENENNADTDKTPLEMENALLRNDAVNTEECFCRCIDVCVDNDGCVQGGYIYLRVLNDHALPAVGAECMLRNSSGKIFKNITDNSGCVGWCRVKKDEYSAEVQYKNVIKSIKPSWDTLPKIITVHF